MRIAIVGAGISGLVCAHYLNRNHEITVFESNGYAGGHTNTVPVREHDRSISVDTGFIVYNEEYYPAFTSLLRYLGVATKPTTMSLSVRCDSSGLEYSGASLNGLFAQRRNLISPGFWRMIAGILHFQREGPQLRAGLDDTITVDRFIRDFGYPEEFVNYFLIPMGSALWSAPAGSFRDFPMRFVIDFFANHGMMQIRNRPDWRVIDGGSHRYVTALTRPFASRIRLSDPVHALRRTAHGVEVRTAAGVEAFDEAIVACHADRALALLDTPSAGEQTLLSAFPYERNDAVLHTDTSVLPRNRRAWGCWNYHLHNQSDRRASVTYDMNRLQGLRSERRYCVSLNEAGIDESKIIRRITYHHPAFRPGRDRAQGRHAELIRRERVSYCGAYWGSGFHEAGVQSAQRVCAAFGEDTR
ncbi:MAG: FAD-dependent oxidoreductase [Bryobacteraceae bacterium]